jgi:putative sigma-54 modulation protein
MIKIHSIHFDSDKKLENFIEAKVNKLIKLDSNIIGAEVFLRLEKSQDKDNKVSEIRLEVPGYDLFAKKQSHSFEAATDIAVDALRMQLKKYKGKKENKK